MGFEIITEQAIFSFLKDLKIIYFVFSQGVMRSISEINNMFDENVSTIDLYLWNWL